MEPTLRDRLDRWLWQARFFKTRSLAARMISDGHVRVDGQRTVKPSTAIGPGNVLTFPQGSAIRVVRIEAIGTRRGPAAEARALYADLTPETEERTKRTGPRPTGRDRRTMDTFRRGSLE